ATRQEVERRGLLGEQHRVVPGQHDDRRAKPQMPGARTEPGEEVERRRHLAIAGEMMLDDKGAAKPEPFGFDIVVDPVAKPLAAVEIDGVGCAGPPRRRAAEQTELHDATLPTCLWQD